MRHRTNETAKKATPQRRQEPPILTTHLFTRLLLPIAMWPYGLWLSKLGLETAHLVVLIVVPIAAFLLGCVREPK